MQNEIFNQFYFFPKKTNFFPKKLVSFFEKKQNSLFKSLVDVLETYQLCGPEAYDNGIELRLFNIYVKALSDPDTVEPAIYDPMSERLSMFVFTSILLHPSSLHPSTHHILFNLSHLSPSTLHPSTSLHSPSTLHPSSTFNLSVKIPWEKSYFFF